MTFRATLLLSGRTATGIEVPADVVAGLGGGRRPAVHATVNGHTYRSTVAPMGGVFMLPVSAEQRAAAGVVAGEDVTVDLRLDTEPRTVAVPADLQAALDPHPDALAFFVGLAPSLLAMHVGAVEGAKSSETRERRVAKIVDLMRERKPR